MISSCNIACGGHAGDTSSMKHAILLAKKHGVEVGAHPSYPDRSNFGRASQEMTSEALIDTVRGQIAELNTILKREKTALHHIKAHGALYNDIARDAELAGVYLEALADYKEDVPLYVPYKSEIAELARGSGYSVIYEAFGDRNYHEDLRLVSRRHPKALIEDPHAVLEHIVRMVQHGHVRTLSGENIQIKAETLCIHGDTPLAFEIVSYLSNQLPEQNIQIKK